ncbi:2Fe-2S iron-sulfur cluster-binding protein [Halobaculum sp. MBLA0147]|uniref:2Fe-2S iron-sulfur cluster-binding protein n=1 Tax=Halobaculum sp. MBLA0147 TaxID=3079934 RepID=UPI0035256E8A
MPTVTFRGESVTCDRGDVLRDVLLAAGLSPHNGAADGVNCRGRGSCGTCAVAVTGAVSDPSRRERLRLRVPPHDAENGLRLACQTRVLGDVAVTKYPGFWGQHVNDAPVGAGDGEPVGTSDRDSVGVGDAEPVGGDDETTASDDDVA